MIRNDAVAEQVDAIGTCGDSSKRERRLRTETRMHQSDRGTEEGIRTDHPEDGFE